MNLGGKKKKRDTHTTGPSTLPEADVSRKLHVCNDAGGVHVVQCPLIADGGGEVAPLLFVDHKASD